MSNHFWLLNEGLFLLERLVLNVFEPSNSGILRKWQTYAVIGWLVPFIYISSCIWVLAKDNGTKKHSNNHNQVFLSDAACWDDLYDDQYNFKVINIPIIMCVVANFLIFARLMCLMVPLNNYGNPSSALLNNHMMRLIRSIFMLIPLLGLHFMYETRA